MGLVQDDGGLLRQDEVRAEATSVCHGQDELLAVNGNSIARDLDEIPGKKSTCQL